MSPRTAASCSIQSANCTSLGSLPDAAAPRLWPCFSRSPPRSDLDSSRHGDANPPPQIFSDGNGVERLGAKLMEWRAVTAPHENTTRSFRNVRCLASAFHLLKK
jgi:hypothetical protein